MTTLNHQLASLHKEDLWRTRRIISQRQNKLITINHQTMINFAENDYLSLAQDQRIKDAFIEGVKEFGFGSSSSALICGYSRHHHQLEEHFANFLGRERAILFNSGYHANLGVMTTFANRNTPVIADKHCHASIIDAITLSRAPHYRYRHHDIAHADALLAKQAKRPALLVTESIFSMTGTITSADQMSALAKRHQATLIMDDAHGFGVLGQHGRGIDEQFHLSPEDISILITPLGKALGGMGAIVSGSNDIIELLLQKARTYCYSTATPPAICSAALCALKIINAEPWRIEHLQALIKFFNRETAKRNLTLFSTDLTPIKCIASGTNKQTLALQDKLGSRGFLVAAIRPPTVPLDAARIRISLSTAHTEADIIQLLDLIAAHHDH